MANNRWVNYINQTLAIIKISTYSIIAIVGIIKLFTNSDSRLNWKNQGDTDITMLDKSLTLIL
jgi:hypothetical protein